MSSAIKIPGRESEKASLVEGGCFEGEERLQYQHSTVERCQNMTVGVGWKRGKSEEVRTTFIASVAVQWSAQRGIG